MCWHMTGPMVSPSFPFHPSFSVAVIEADGAQIPGIRAPLANENHLES